MSKHGGSMKSYVIGFALSIALTIIPYLMVTRQESPPGVSLLIVILVFAFAQMIVQLVYFLHLGRGPKPMYNVAFYSGTVGMILVVTAGSVFIIHNLHGRMSPEDTIRKIGQHEAIAQIGGEKTGACQERGENHIVTIQDGIVDKSEVSATRCDTLTFVSRDSGERKITFGFHEEHYTYGGESEITVTSRRHKSITLNETGAYTFHDHLDPSVAGTFIVNP